MLCSLSFKKLLSTSYIILESVSNKVNLICRRFVTSFFETIFESLEYILNKIFKLEERNTNFKTEIIAGISTFFTLSFIIAVNPAFLSDAGIDFAAGFVGMKSLTGEFRELTPGVWVFSTFGLIQLVFI